MQEIAMELAYRLGIPCQEAVTLARGMNIIVHLRPSPIVARIPSVAHRVRPFETWRDSVTFGKALHNYVVPPTVDFDAGPHLEHGYPVTLWTYTEHIDATPEETGRSLRTFHQAAARYRGPLRRWNPRGEALLIAKLIGEEEGAILQRAAEIIESPELAEQPIHGDANFGNVMAGGKWLDLDDVCLGPPEWDIACLCHLNTFWGTREDETRRALAAYGSFDESAVAALAPLVTLSIAAWGAMALVVSEKIGPRTQQRLNWLREHYG